jgi:hypothetical protein
VDDPDDQKEKLLVVREDNFEETKLKGKSFQTVGQEIPDQGSEQLHKK